MLPQVRPLQSCVPRGSTVGGIHRVFRPYRGPLRAYVHKVDPTRSKTRRACTFSMLLTQDDPALYGPAWDSNPDSFLSFPPLSPPRFLHKLLSSLGRTRTGSHWASIEFMAPLAEVSRTFPSSTKGALTCCIKLPSSGVPSASPFPPALTIDRSQTDKPELVGVL
jgi:hypothetical protein